MGYEPTEEEIEEYCKNNVYRKSGNGLYEAKLDPNKCPKSVYGHWSSHQCGNKGKYKEGGFGWCGHHAPSKVISKRKAQKAQMDLKWKIKRKGWAVSSAHTKISEAAIAYFHQKASFDDIEAAVNEYESLKREYEEMKGRI